jgi:Integrase core domain
MREECLNVSWFENLFDARRKITAWQKEYNEERPHSSLGYLTPQEFATRAWEESYGKDGGHAALENASGVSTFPQLRRPLLVTKLSKLVVSSRERKKGAGH